MDIPTSPTAVFTRPHPWAWRRWALLGWLVAATAISLNAAAGEVFTDAAPSAALGRDMRFTIYLPDGYPNGAAAPYPVIYLLHGAGGDENEWRVRLGARETLDGLIARGQIRPAVVVMPTAGPASWWTDGAAEKAGTAVMTELIPHVEKTYRVSRDRAGRSIAGLSMGGYGALNLSLRNPSAFCAAGLISAASYDPLPPETSAARKAPQFMRAGQFDSDTWKSLNYASQLDSYQAQPWRVPMWIVSGDHDRLGIAPMSANLYWRLRQIQPKQVELRVVDGDHEWMTFRDALPDALRFMNKACSQGNGA